MVKISSSSVSHGNRIAYYDIIHRKQGTKLKLFIGGQFCNFLKKHYYGSQTKILTSFLIKGTHFKRNTYVRIEQLKVMKNVSNKLQIVFKLTNLGPQYLG